MPKESTLEQTNFKTMEVESYLAGFPEVKELFTTVGMTTGSMSGSQATPYA
jgi:HAE1 family hydrophobic/amphiphilic exporter-1